MFDLYCKIAYITIGALFLVFALMCAHEDSIKRQEEEDAE